jgi:hypothetical protein
MVLATAAIFVQVAPASPFNEPWSWGGRDAVDGGRMQAVDALEEIYGMEGAVAVSPQLTALVAERWAVHELPAGPPAEGWRPDVPAMILDTTAVGDDGDRLWSDSDQAIVLANLRSASYAVAYEGAGIILLLHD